MPKGNLSPKKLARAQAQLLAAQGILAQQQLVAGDFAPAIHGHTIGNVTGLASNLASLAAKLGMNSQGQNVITASKVLGSSDVGTNILLATVGITITFPATGFASGEGFAIRNISGGNVTLTCPGGSDFGATLPNGGSLFVFSDGGGYWRQYAYSAAGL